jgi:hypothetical protein
MSVVDRVCSCLELEVREGVIEIQFLLKLAWANVMPMDHKNPLHTHMDAEKLHCRVEPNSYDSVPSRPLSRGTRQASL